VTGLRVAHLGTETAWRGGEQQQAWLAQGLVRRGHSCLMICNGRGEMLRRAPELGLEARGVPVSGDLGVRTVTAAAAAMREFEPHVAHLHDGHAVLAGALASKLARVPAVVVSRRVDFRIRSRWKYTWATDRIVAISEAVRRVLVDCGVPAGLVTVVNSGVDLARMEHLPPREEARRALGLEGSEPVVGMVAALTDHKGHRYLLEAWPRVLAARPQARLLLAGDGELGAELRAQADSLGISGSVRFLGFHADVPGLLAALDLFVLSSHLEGLCTSLIDAMAAGLAAVATAAGGIPEVAEHGRTALLVPPRDPPALAAAIIELLGDPARREALGRAGREAVRGRFGVDRMVESTLEIYGQILAGKGLA